MKIRVTAGFVEWLEEAINLLDYLNLKRIHHFTTLQKFTARISNPLLQNILLSFITAHHIKGHTIGIDATGFKSAFSQYYDIEPLPILAKECLLKIQYLPIQTGR